MFVNFPATAQSQAVNREGGVNYWTQIFGRHPKATVTVVCKMEAIEKLIPSRNVGDRFSTYLENAIYYIKCQSANTEYLPQTSLIAMLSKGIPTLQTTIKGRRALARSKKSITSRVIISTKYSIRRRSSRLSLVAHSRAQRTLLQPCNDRR